MTKELRRELRGMVKDSFMRREAARLGPPKIGRRAGDLTLDRYLGWLSEMGRAFPSGRQPADRRERIRLP